MVKSTEPLTLDEHHELARELRNTNLRLRELSNVVLGIYGAESRVTFSFVRATEALDRLRHEMQIQAALDWPGNASDRLYL